eukprot:TRINITY_DN1251_c0_g1_i3.p1 TRINITY_DN1251_c0_g1~~TRINITY_DN1251_c0_g1_i3.p1  ORF type:complete len:108 (-),score=17.65 TRINITY_DN1251_c0_g1_i3:194-517(-)
MLMVIHQIHLIPACPLVRIFITNDIQTIVHTDPNPEVLFKDETFDGEIVIPNTPPSELKFLENNNNIKVDMLIVPNSPIPIGQEHSDLLSIIKHEQSKGKPSGEYSR